MCSTNSGVRFGGFRTRGGEKVRGKGIDASKAILDAANDALGGRKRGSRHTRGTTFKGGNERCGCFLDKRGNAVGSSADSRRSTVGVFARFEQASQDASPFPFRLPQLRILGDDPESGDKFVNRRIGEEPVYFGFRSPFPFLFVRHVDALHLNYLSEAAFFSAKLLAGRIAYFERTASAEC
jgi:hypothetical protein